MATTGPLIRYFFLGRRSPLEQTWHLGYCFISVFFIDKDLLSHPFGTQPAEGPESVGVRGLQFGDLAGVRHFPVDVEHRAIVAAEVILEDADVGASGDEGEGLDNEVRAPSPGEQDGVAVQHLEAELGFGVDDTVGRGGGAEGQHGGEDCQGVFHKGNSRLIGFFFTVVLLLFFD